MCDKYIKVNIYKFKKGLAEAIHSGIKLMILLSLPTELCDNRCASSDKISILKEVGWAQENIDQQCKIITLNNIFNLLSTQRCQLNYKHLFQTEHM